MTDLQRMQKLYDKLGINYTLIECENDIVIEIKDGYEYCQFSFDLSSKFISVDMYD